MYRANDLCGNFDIFGSASPVSPICTRVLLSLRLSVQQIQGLEPLKVLYLLSTI